MKNTLETRLGIFFALTIIAAVLLIELVGGLEFLRPGIHVRALFNNIQDLKKGDQVKMGGVRIGKVDSLTITNEKIMVTMKLEANTQVRTDSKASIKFVGLMGQNYVSIDFGTTKGALAAEGAILDIVEQPDFSALMTKLDGVATGIENVTKSFSGENFSNLLGPFTDFLKENNPKFVGILTNVQEITEQIRSGKGTVGKLVKEDELYNTALSTVSNLNHTATDVQTLITSAKTVVDDVNAGHGTIGKLVKDETLYNVILGGVTNASEILQKINQGYGTVGKLVNDDSLYRQGRLSLQKLDKATEGLEDQGPLSVLGMAINKLF